MVPLGSPPTSPPTPTPLFHQLLCPRPESPFAPARAAVAGSRSSKMYNKSVMTSSLAPSLSLPTMTCPRRTGGTFSYGSVAQPAWRGLGPKATNDSFFGPQRPSKSHILDSPSSLSVDNGPYS